MKNKSGLVFLIIVVTAYSVQNTYASLASVLDYDVMIEKADFIIVGNVTRIQYYTYTYVTIAIREFVTNPQNMSQITITIGGELRLAGEISRDSFYVGERVLVFVEKIGPYYRVLLGDGGKYRVLEEWPSYVGTPYITILGGWHTSDWRPRSVVHGVAKSTDHGTVNLLPIVFTQIFFAVLLIPILFVFMKRKKLL